MSRDAAAHAFATQDNDSGRRKSESEYRIRTSEPLDLIQQSDGLRYQLVHLGPQVRISRAAQYAAVIAAVEREQGGQRSYEKAENTRGMTVTASPPKGTPGRGGPPSTDSEPASDSR